MAKSNFKTFAKGMRLQPQKVVPATALKGSLYFDDLTNTLYVRHSGGWNPVGQGGGSGNVLEQLSQKLALENFGQVTEDLSNSIGLSGFVEPVHKQFTLYSMQDITASDTKLYLAMNPAFFNDADPNSDSLTGWTVGHNNATNLALDGTNKKVGTNSYSFDKSGGGTDATIRYDRGSQNLALKANRYLEFWHYIPTLTNFTEILVRIYGANTSDYQEYTTTVNSEGGAIIAGENHIVIDLEDLSGASGGAGWSPDELARYGDIGSRWTNGATPTGLRLDAIVFSTSEAIDMSFIGSQMTLHDDADLEDILLDSASASIFVPTLTSGIVNAYVGGFTGSTIALIKRSTMKFDGAMQFDRDPTGDIELEQVVRQSVVLPEQMTANFKLFTDSGTQQVYTVDSVGGSSIDVNSDVDDSADLVNTDVVDVWRPKKTAGKVTYEYVGEFTITGSSYAANIITINMTPTGIQALDIVRKRVEAEIAVSMVDDGVNENFQNIDLSAATKTLIEVGQPYIDVQSVWGDWYLGAPNEAMALRNNRGQGPALTKTGTPNLKTPFQKGYYGASGFSGTSWLDTTIANSKPISGATADCTSLSVDFWLKDNTGFSGGTVGILGRWTGNNGWLFVRDSGTNTIYVYHNANLNALQFSFTVGVQYHIAYVLEAGVDSYLYVNGVLVDTNPAPTVSDAGTSLQVGGVNSGGNPYTGGVLSRLTIRRNYKLSAAQVARIYNNGNYLPQGYDPMMRTQIDVNGLTGQKLSVRGKIRHQTNAIESVYNKIGLIKA